jgi:mannonate dehydratase
MAFEETWRWFGPNDPITLQEIKQTGATGIVSALHHIPIGEVWSLEEIQKRRKTIETDGLTWSVVESVPVHENIKKRKANYQQLIANYQQTIKNLGACGIDIVCYNFMPVLDWSRTDLHVTFKDGSITSKFDYKAFAAFDLFILNRKNAEKNYTPEQIYQAKEYFTTLSETQKKKLTDTILFGLPGSLQAYTLEEFRAALAEYDSLSETELRNHLCLFLKDIIPTAMESGVYMTIHPDDPPFSLLGLPRIVSTKKDIEQIHAAVDSPSNGLTFCTGSFGAGYKNDLVDLAATFANRINFIHLRNVQRNQDGDFLEENHLEGDIDLYSVIRIILLEQKRRIAQGRKDSRMPFRPDHGHLMIPDQQRAGIYPGYSLFGRMRGLAELRGLELGILRSLEE